MKKICFGMLACLAGMSAMEARGEEVLIRAYEAMETGETETVNGVEYPVLEKGRLLGNALTGEEGSTVECTSFDTSALEWMGEGCGEFLCRVILENTTDKPLYIVTVMIGTENPTWEMCQGDGVKTWGDPGFCLYRLTCYGPGDHNFGETSNVPGRWLKLPPNGEGNLIFEIHDRFLTPVPEGLSAYFMMNNYVVDLESENYDLMEETSYLVHFTNTETGIGAIEESCGVEPAEIYDLCGRRVSGTEPGIYIFRNAKGKTAKRVLR